MVALSCQEKNAASTQKAFRYCHGYDVVGRNEALSRVRARIANPRYRVLSSGNFEADHYYNIVPMGLSKSK